MFARSAFAVHDRESNGPGQSTSLGLAMLGSASSVFVVRCGALFGAFALIVLAVGGGVAAGRATGSGAGGLFVVSATGGSARQLAPVPALTLSPGQNAAIAAEAQPDGTVSLAVRELGSGAEQTIFVTPPGQDPAAPLGFGEAVWPTPVTVVFDWLNESHCTPAGTSCALARLESVRADSTGLQRLSDSGRYPAFARGGSRLVYLDRYSFFDGGLVTLASAGGAKIRRFGWSSYGPALAPDGRTLAWIGGRSATASADFGPVLRVARGGRQLAQLRVLELGLDGSSGERAPLAWSPDGRTLAFIRSTIAQASRPRSALCFATPALRSVRCPYAASQLAAPLWSPDGSRVAVGATRQSGGQLIVAIHAHGRVRPRILASASAGVFVPIAWSRDGRRLFFDGP
jgi:hypothetical protein